MLAAEAVGNCSLTFWLIKSRSGRKAYQAPAPAIRSTAATRSLRDDMRILLAKQKLFWVIRLSACEATVTFSCFVVCALRLLVVDVRQNLQQAGQALGLRHFRNPCRRFWRVLVARQ